MKEKTAKKATYIGAGVGIVLFALFGLLPGSFLGGVMGLNIAGAIFGTPLTSGVLSRLVVGISMLVGVLVSGMMFVAGFSVTGWLLGSAVDKLAERHPAPVAIK